MCRWTVWFTHACACSHGCPSARAQRSMLVPHPQQLLPPHPPLPTHLHLLPPCTLPQQQLPIRPSPR